MNILVIDVGGTHVKISPPAKKTNEKLTPGRP